MSRSDQYIGLTKDAEEFLDNLVKNKNAKREKIVLVPEEGTLCFGCDITGDSVTEMHDDDSANICTIYTECLQHVMWSSGPMYFTHIMAKIIKRYDPTNAVEYGPLFSWVNNPMVNGEVDPIKGHYNL